MSASYVTVAPRPSPLLPKAVSAGTSSPEYLSPVRTAESTDNSDPLAKKFRQKTKKASSGLGATVTAQLACDTLQMALWRRRMPTGVIVHADRGSQYCSGAYQALIKKHSLLCSMSAKGFCYDNACAESFFHTLKVEAIHGEQFATRKDMRQTAFEYVELNTIKPADTAPTATSVPKRLRRNSSFNEVFTIRGKVHRRTPLHGNLFSNLACVLLRTRRFRWLAPQAIFLDVVETLSQSYAD